MGYAQSRPLRFRPRGRAGRDVSIFTLRFFVERSRHGRRNAPRPFAVLFRRRRQRRSHARNLAREVADLLRACGGKNEKRLGVDTANILVFDALAKEGIEVGYANAAMEHARSIKSDDEIRAMRASLAVCERGMRRMHDALRPGITEVELWSLLHAENIAGGGEWIECRLLASGPRTNPWFQEASFRPIENGDLVSYDTDMVGPFGYCADLSRALVCGDKPPTAAQKEAYRIAYDKIHFNIDLLRPGMRFEEFARKVSRRRTLSPPTATRRSRTESACATNFRTFRIRKIGTKPESTAFSPRA